MNPNPIPSKRRRMFGRVSKVKAKHTAEGFVMDVLGGDDEPKLGVGFERHTTRVRFYGEWGNEWIEKSESSFSSKRKTEKYYCRRRSGPNMFAQRTQCNILRVLKQEKR